MYQGAGTGLLAGSATEGFEAARMLIKPDLGVEIAIADVSGWDTHVAQGSADGQLSARRTELGQGLAALATDLGERMQDVVVLTMSEFGRTGKENGSAGTDHGHGTAMLLLRGSVKGGRVLGQWPGLDEASRYEGRDWAVTTDSRVLFSEVLKDHLGVSDISAVFPGFTPPPAGAQGACGSG